MNRIFIRSRPRATSSGSCVVLTILITLLIATVVVAALGWSSAVGVKVPRAGYVAMLFGVLFSLIFGIGLMALVFYSSRAGYDEPAKLVGPGQEQKRVNDIR